MDQPVFILIYRAPALFGIQIIFCGYQYFCSLHWTDKYQFHPRNLFFFFAILCFFFFFFLFLGKANRPFSFGFFVLTHAMLIASYHALWRYSNRYSPMIDVVSYCLGYYIWSVNALWNKKLKHFQILSEVVEEISSRE